MPRVAQVLWSVAWLQATLTVGRVPRVAQWLEDKSVSWIEDEVTLAKRVVAALNNPQMLEQ